MSKLYLIPLDHRDTLKGPEKLEKLLDRLKPDIILTENSQGASDEARFREDLLKRGLRQELLALSKENQSWIFFMSLYHFPSFLVQIMQ